MKDNLPALDIVIIGGGPAGLSTALWCAELGLRAILIEKEAELGGQLLSIHNSIENYLGHNGINGRELRDRFLQNIEGNGVGRSSGVGVVRADLSTKTVVLNDGTSYSAKAIVIATGVRRRRLGIDGEEKFQGRGILRSGAAEKEKVAGKRVLIVGGGDAALENAVILSEFAERVFVVHRRAKFSARSAFVEDAERLGNVEFVLNTTISAILGDTRVKAVALGERDTGEQYDLPVDSVLIRIGVQPNTELFCGQLTLDALGYIRVDADCMTDLPGIFAAGDVASPISPTISTAVGMGTTAGKSILRWIDMRYAQK